MQDTITLDLQAIHAAQHACGLAWRKRGRALREAQAALALAREALALAKSRVSGAEAARLQAEAARRDALAACTGAQHGHDLASRVGWCEHSARLVAEREGALAHAQGAALEAQTQLDARGREALRAERLLEQAADTVKAWQARERLAVETHADLALEDEPPRRPLGATL